MTLLFVTTAAAMITPVGLDDALLSQPETFISDIAREQMVTIAVQELHCLDLPEDASEYDRVCLSVGEWQQVFDEIAQQESVDARERAMMIAQYYNSN
ncbi:hypothetical protein [Aurantiacibacter gangjinensis]|uniref:Uncharacterized protein n=1 Tax=Aurantiacibacter gangjinensis TaxID=502682 RepID=A0A0G9MQH9_9SPHN|nr:hypothetical protein [Aurantiacibacter gangjinensis]APE28651.1 hypothetical protein BMF35_a1822 [Aurantiacibacter gangjinensis]KLE32824.1 hypothetical protein AAW01_02000 [Aurantiacibacter gangjinensis]